MLKIFNKKIKVKSQSQTEFVDITNKVEEVVLDSGVRNGQVLVYAPHSTAGIAINHNEPMLIHDFMQMLYRIVPIEERYSHDLFELKRSKLSDGRSNGHSHCKNLLIGVSEVLPVEKRKILITEKQSIFLVELDGGRTREIIIQVMGV